MALGGTMSIDSQLQRGLREDLKPSPSLAVFVAIAGVSSTSKLSRAFNDIEALDVQEAIALKRTLDEMKALQADIAAHVGCQIPIAWKPAIREVLEARRRAPQLWSLELNSGFFVRRQRITGDIITDRREAAALSLADATKTQERLSQLGYSSRLVPSKSSIQILLEDIWE